jgi:hypothetical protein
MMAIKSKLEAGVATAQAKIHDADREKASRVDAVSAAAQKLAELERAAKIARESMNADNAMQATARRNLASAEKAVISAEADLASAERKKAKLENVRKDVFEPLRTCMVTGLQIHRDLSKLAKVLSECGCESSLGNSLAEAFGKKVEARSTFDDIVIRELETQMRMRVAQLEATAIYKRGERKLDVVNAKIVAEAAHTMSSEKSAASRNAFIVADAALLDGKKAFGQAKAAIRNFGNDMKLAAASLASAQSDLNTFMEGAFKSFELLEHLAPPSPELAP